MSIASDFLPYQKNIGNDLQRNREFTTVLWYSESILNQLMGGESR
jgi:hypothetical protein